MTTMDAEVAGLISEPERIGDNWPADDEELAHALHAYAMEHGPRRPWTPRELANSFCQGYPGGATQARSRQVLRVFRRLLIRPYFERVLVDKTATYFVRRPGVVKELLANKPCYDPGRIWIVSAYKGVTNLRIGVVLGAPYVEDLVERVEMYVPGLVMPDGQGNTLNPIRQVPTQFLRMDTGAYWSDIPGQPPDTGQLSALIASWQESVDAANPLRLQVDTRALWALMEDRTMDLSDLLEFAQRVVVENERRPEAHVEVEERLARIAAALDILANGEVFTFSEQENRVSPLPLDDLPSDKQEVARHVAFARLPKGTLVQHNSGRQGKTTGRTTQGCVEVRVELVWWNGATETVIKRWPDRDIADLTEASP